MDASKTKTFLELVSELLVEIENDLDAVNRYPSYMPVLERLIELEEGIRRAEEQKRMIESQKTINQKQ